MEQNMLVVQSKVQAAFDALEKRGDWICRMFFSCCKSCGSYELSTELKASGKHKAAFFSIQARRQLVPGGTLCISFGWNDGEDPENTAVGEELKEALEAEGLRVEWDGRPFHCVEVPVE